MGGIFGICGMRSIGGIFGIGGHGAGIGTLGGNLDGACIIELIIMFIISLFLVWCLTVMKSQ